MRLAASRASKIQAAVCAGEALVTAARIATVEAHHGAAIALDLGRRSPHGRLDKPLTDTAVLTAVKAPHFIPALG